VFDLTFVVSLLVFSVLCFFEFFVFNEETLLAVCFFSFIFFGFNSLGDTVSDIFHSRAVKFEGELLLSFSLSKQSIVKFFHDYFLSRGFGSKLKILSMIISNFLSLSAKHSLLKLTSSFHKMGLTSLFELVSSENVILIGLQKKCVSLLLYPLIFQITKTNFSFLIDLTTTEHLSVITAKTSILKSLS